MMDSDHHPPPSPFSKLTPPHSTTSRGALTIFPALSIDIRPRLSSLLEETSPGSSSQSSYYLTHKDANSLHPSFHLHIYPSILPSIHPATQISIHHPSINPPLSLSLHLVNKYLLSILYISQGLLQCPQHAGGHQGYSNNSRRHCFYPDKIYGNRGGRN